MASLILAMLSAGLPSSGAATAARAEQASLQPLSVKGNQIMRGDRPFRFYGVNRDSLEWGTFNWGGCGGDGHFTDADFDRIAGWRVTAVRLPLSQAGWLGRRCDPGTYAAHVDAAVAKANARGMYAILDLHWSDVGGRSPCDGGCRSGQQPMPDADSARFWAEVARRYANQPGVIFDLYNEPHDVPWRCWRDGGCTVRSSLPDPATGEPVLYTAVGMQQLYDVVRAQGASNLVLVAGLDWAYDLRGVGRGYALDGFNIAYDTHVYTQWHRKRADWKRHFGFLTGRKPVVSTEFGSIDCSAGDTARLIRYFDAPGKRRRNRMAWTIWSWNAPGECSQPSLIADWWGTPLPGQGELIRSAIQARAGG